MYEADQGLRSGLGGVAAADGGHADLRGYARIMFTPIMLEPCLFQPCFHVAGYTTNQSCMYICIMYVCMYICEVRCSGENAAGH